MRNGIDLEKGAEPFPGLRLRQLLGRGGFAEVWEAETKKGTTVALKFMSSNRTGSTSKEVRSIQAVQAMLHPNLLRVEQVWSVPDYIIVAMEVADGSMLDLLDLYHEEFRSPLPPEVLFRHLSEAAAALDFLNARQHTFDGKRVGFQHCDVKPSNILLINDVAKLADFGLSTPTIAPLTPYQRCGTPDFAPPEFHRGVVADQSDQYSLAVSFVYLRTGQFPFPPAPQSFLRRLSYTRPEPDLSRLLPAEAAILARALSPQPDERWESCSAMMSALTRTLNGNGHGKSPIVSPSLPVGTTPR